MGQALFRLLTWMSLLATVGSFVIAALPVVDNFHPENGPEEYTPQIQHEEQRLMAPRDNEIDQPGVDAIRDSTWPEWRAQMIRAGLWVIAFCATGLAIIRLVRRQREGIANDNSRANLPAANRTS